VRKPVVDSAANGPRWKRSWTAGIFIPANNKVFKERRDSFAVVGVILWGVRFLLMINQARGHRNGGPADGGAAFYVLSVLRPGTIGKGLRPSGKVFFLIAK